MVPAEGVDVTKDDAPSAVLQALAGRQVALLVVCAGYQTLDSLSSLDLGEVDKHWQVRGHSMLLAAYMRC
jgi:short-subunit dehydrogenase